jgi:SHS family sialic acid transporter-like MFS transporter
VSSLSKKDRLKVLVAAFLGWMFAGVIMSIMIPATRPAIQEFLSADTSTNAIQLLEQSAESWFSWYLVAFFLGAALGGAVLGSVGDRYGRVKAMGISILCYSCFTGLSYFASSPEQLLVLRFIACMGIGGMWPSGVALVAESWPDVSRPILAGLIGTAANVGFLILGILMLSNPITSESWRWVLLLGTTPLILGIWVLLSVPESPRWKSEKENPKTGEKKSSLGEVFRPPLLRLTLVGIFLGTIPLLGGWASGQRLVPWAGRIAEANDLPQLQAMTQTIWAIGAVIGSLAGGWIASRMGRRASYFAVSLLSLGLSLYVFIYSNPTAGTFLPAVFGVGLISTIFFGWLPYFLPELFPTRVRATGAGVSFNFGRILSAVAVLSTAFLINVFQGDIAKMGAATSLVYALGMVIVIFIPKESHLEE